MIRATMTTVDTFVPDHLWQDIQPLLPNPTPRYGGRPRVDDAPPWPGSSTSCALGVPLLNRPRGGRQRLLR
jgi:hypothetical protein